MASEWKNDIITLRRNLFGSIFRMLYLKGARLKLWKPVRRFTVVVSSICLYISKRHHIGLKIIEDSISPSLTCDYQQCLGLWRTIYLCGDSGLPLYPNMVEVGTEFSGNFFTEAPVPLTDTLFS